jgi:Transcriptional antiterminator
MRRIDMVYEKLNEICREDGISALEIADALDLDRANVSKDLNTLCDEGRAAKKMGKPVLFYPVKSDKPNSKQITLDIFAEKNSSLFSIVKQAKAAILYPPNGMHILILGETGVGKSMFAGLIHRYAIEMNMMEESSPFITFNCADYASNPQLLLSQIFGSKKGAYTGSDMDKTGLIEKADGGILFLDEVHRLPPEGQEMFFTFMDKGIFRRLGETEQERKAKVLIISATTENPDSTLLKTFTRRIPMVIHIPCLSERTLEERFNLISEFMKEEASRLERDIKVSVNSMRAFLSYNCQNNIGQLKTDIQLACAKSYADFVSSNKEDISISSLDLPAYIREGLYMNTDHRKIWSKLIDINKRYYIFSENKETKIYDKDDDRNIYEMIDSKSRELKGMGLTGIELDKEIESDIESYFKTYFYRANRNIDTSNLGNIISEEILRVVEEVIKFCEKRLSKTLNEKICYGMAVHINSTIDRIKRNKKIINPQLNKIRTEYGIEFNIALDCIKIIERALDVSIPIDEAGFLAMFLIYDNRDVEEQKNNVRIIVICHGFATATSMVEVVNRLLGVRYAVGIDAPIEEKPQQVLYRLKNYLLESKTQSDVLFLTDMGSFTNFGKEIEDKMGIKTKTIPLVSTLHVLEATRKAMIGYSLNEVYKDTLNVNTLLENELLNNEEEKENKNKLTIVTICTTGEGSAITVKNILHRKLEFDSSILDIVTLNIAGREGIYTKLENIQKEYQIICIVSPFNLDTKIPQFNLKDILEDNAIKLIQDIIDVESTYTKMGDTLENQLKNIKNKDVLNDIKKFVNIIENNLDIKMDTNILIGVTFHLGCMLDRLKSMDSSIQKFDNKEEFILENNELYTVVKNATQFLNSRYSIVIPEDEICYIMTFFNNCM